MRSVIFCFRNSFNTDFVYLFIFAKNTRSRSKRGEENQLPLDCSLQFGAFLHKTLTGSAYIQAFKQYHTSFEVHFNHSNYIVEGLNHIFFHHCKFFCQCRGNFVEKMHQLVLFSIPTFIFAASEEPRMTNFLLALKLNLCQALLETKLRQVFGGIKVYTTG